MFFNNFVSPLKTTNPYDQSTNIIKDNSYVNESLNLLCALYYKKEKSPIEPLSDKCIIYMKIINEKSFEYCLNIKNNKKDSTWNFFQILIDRNFKIFIFDKIPDLKYFMINKYNTFYIFELSNDEINKNNGMQFLEKMEILKISSNSKISINEAMKEKLDAKYIINCKNIHELNIFLENYQNNGGNEAKLQDLNKSRKGSFYLNLYENNIKSSDFIDKNDFMQNFNMYKEIYICQGTAFKYNKYTENIIPIDDDEDEFTFLKINKIGFNNYILVLEKNKYILAFTKIENNIDFSINDELGTMTIISQNLNNKGKNCVYTFSFKDRSLNEIHFIKNIILRCLYEKR